MKRFKIHSQPLLTLTLAALSCFLIQEANAERIFYDSFENLNSSGDPVGWDTEGHPGYLRCISEEEEGHTFTTPYGKYGLFTYTRGVGTRQVDFLPQESGDYILKFNVTSAYPRGEYRAELWADHWIFGRSLLASVSGDTDGTKDMSFTDELSWRYDYDPNADFPLDGAKLEIKLMHDYPGYSTWRSAPIWDNVSVDWVPDVDTSGPTVLDILDDNQGGSVVATDSVVTYTVTFNEPIDATTVDISDFANAASANVTIVSVDPTSDAAVFLIGVTPIDEGTLRLKIDENADLRDTAGNPMNTSVGTTEDDVTFTVEAGTPILLPTDIVDDRGGSSMAENTLVTYTLTFNKDMDETTVSAADFGNAGSALITIGAIAETTATSGVFTVEVTPTGSGTLQFRVNPGVDIRAADGGILNTSSEIADDTTLVVDSDPPMLTEIIDDAGGNPVVVGALLTYDVFFSEDMNASTVDASDFGNAITTGNAPFTIDSVEEASPDVFRIEITPTGAGEIQLQVNAGAVLEDEIGNAMDTTLAILDDATITVNSVISNPYEAWAGGLAFSDDENADGVDNGLAWVLGAQDANVSAKALLPTFDNQTDADYFIYTYRRHDDANGHPDTTIDVEYGTTLSSGSWVIAVHDNDNVVITETDNHYSVTPGIDRVEVKLKRSTLAPEGRLFVRLRVEQTP